MEKWQRRQRVPHWLVVTKDLCFHWYSCSFPCRVAKGLALQLTRSHGESCPTPSLPTKMRDTIYEGGFKGEKINVRSISTPMTQHVGRFGRETYVCLSNDYCSIPGTVPYCNYGYSHRSGFSIDVARNNVAKRQCRALSRSSTSRTMLTAPHHRH